MTSELYGRMEEHKSGAVPGFASKFKMDPPCLLRRTTDVYAALEREKRIKAWRRAKRIALIQSMNLKWLNLSETWAENYLILRSASLREATPSATSARTYSNISTVRATSPAFMARKASLRSSRPARRLIMSSSCSRPWR